MQLSGPELSRLKQWSRFRKSWRRLRWFCLFVATVEIIGGAWILHKLVALPDIAVRLWPTAFVFTVTGGVCLGVTLISWRDDLPSRLSARLLAEQENQQQ
jgi:hypothetical protein